MSIVTKAFCDQCQTEIEKEKDRPGFSQMSWCYFRKGNQLMKTVGGKPLLSESWQGKVNRMEYCQEHGNKLNVLLKAFQKNDNRLLKVLDELMSEDRSQWNGKQKDIENEFVNLCKGKHK